MKNLKRKFNVIVIKRFLLFAFGYVGLATLVGTFLFNQEQTREQIISNLGSAVVVGIMLIWAEWDELKEKFNSSQKVEEF
jgi:hypothetical protein